jgi:site-specific DNA-methyltransferase (adenine-specific)
VAERELATHPSLKPQSFLRQVVRAVLPFAEGLVLDPFSGSGSTLAAATALGLRSIGIERDAGFAAEAKIAIPALAAIKSEHRTGADGDLVVVQSSAAGVL